MKLSGWTNRAVWSFVSVATFAACEELPAEIDLSDDDPVLDGGPAHNTDPLAVTGSDSSAAPDAAVVEGDAGRQLDPMYAQVFALFTAHCVSCHGAGKTLDLSSAELAHEQLVGVGAKYKACAGDGGPQHVRVIAGSASESLLMAKLEGRQTCGKQMPPDGLLTAEDLAVFEAWIEAGAKLH